MSGEHRPRPALWLAAQVVFSVVAAAVLFGGAEWALSDVTLYYQWTGRVVDGQVPYRDFFFDYPPLSLPVLLAPRGFGLFGEITYGTYVVLFAALMVAVSVALAQVVRGVGRRVAPSDGVLARHLALMAISLPILLIRYDLWPILTVALAFLSTLDRRPVLAGSWLAIGIAAKLYPVVLLPAFAVYWWVALGRRSATLHVGSALGVTAALLVPFLALTDGAIGDMLRFQQQRGLQVETAAGGIIQLLGSITGQAPSIVHTGTYELESDGVTLFLAVQPMIATVGLGAATLAGAYGIWRAARQRRAPEALAAVAIAILIVFILTNRALSPQHVFWGLSFAALLAGRRYVMLVAAIGLTILVFPILYQGLLAQELLPILLLNFRNALLATLAVLLLVRPLPD